jgi:hypothetical protein
VVQVQQQSAVDMLQAELARRQGSLEEQSVPAIR